MTSAATRRRIKRIRIAANSVFGTFLALLPDRLLASSIDGLPAAGRSDAGTLPLLAALGLGIAVAAAAVVAFLQMTTKGRAGTDYVFPDVEAEDSSGRGDEPIADYTIPLSRIPGGAPEPEAEEGEGPTLCGIRGEFAGAHFRVREDGLTIGRDASACQVVFRAESGEVSRRHCRLRYERETRTFYLEDLGSSNGTFLSGGEKLQPGRRYALRPGDRFALSGGKHQFEVKA